ncbi:Pentatricopeptide repeat-containing protein [Trichinella spiralis]|uniref:Pentatricopeptide repeat-containing protein n=1 Tax=Trichinella spiralis TaxID=6334 RepID=A0ABR3K583_TRISP
MSSFVHRSLSLPGSVELLCTTGLLLAKQAVTSCVLRLHQLQRSSCQSATSLPTREYLCSQCFINASNFQLYISPYLNVNAACFSVSDDTCRRGLNLIKRKSIST